VPAVQVYVPLDPALPNAIDLFNVTVPAVCVNKGKTVLFKLAVPPYVKEPLVNTKLTEGFNVPPFIINAGLLTVNVVQFNIPSLRVNVPAVYVAVLEHVNTPPIPVVSNVPAVIVKVVQLNVYPG